MPEENPSNQPTKSVAPGYPAIEALKDIDVTGWEPAAVFVPVDLPGARTEDANR